MNPLRNSNFVSTTTSSGITVQRFAILDSTNEEAFRQLAEGRVAPMWIVADEQWNGRGRNGRSWYSPRGNLYASLLLLTSVPTAIATQLSFVGALAAHDAIASIVPPSRRPSLQLKWPNDVMIDAAKVAGILLESVRSNAATLAVVMGFGINVSQMPTETGRSVSTLSLDSSMVPGAFEALSHQCEHWIKIWNEGVDFPAIREAWLTRTFPLGQEISVNLNGAPIRGKFFGLDESGALQIETQTGVVKTITTGDVFSDETR